MRVADRTRRSQALPLSTVECGLKPGLKDKTTLFVNDAMSLKIYNTLTQKKETFAPVRPGKVGIYLCGPTVYKPSHIGHAVGPIIFDTVKR